MYQTPDAEDVIEDECYILRFPGSAAFKGLVNGALASLVFENAWEADGTLSPQDTAQIFKNMLVNSEYRCMIGSIIPMATADVPNWALPCNGATYAKTTYPKLWAVLADVFKTETDFTLPDMRDKTVVGAKTGIGGSYTIGDTGGESEHTLTTAELAEHSHTNNPHSHTDVGHQHIITPPGTAIPAVAPGEVPLTAINLLPGLTASASANLTSDSIVIDVSGEGEAHNNMPPFIALHWVIVAK